MGEYNSAFPDADVALVDTLSVGDKRARTQFGELVAFGITDLPEDAFAVGYDNACTLPCAVFTDDGEVAVELQCACALVDIVCQHQCFVIELAG